MTNIQFTTQTDDGTATDADALPTAVLVVDGNDAPDAVTITHLETGVYRASFLRPASYDTLQIRATATVGGKLGKGEVWREGTEALVRAKLGGVGAPTDPVLVVPGPPADLSLGTVYAYLETPDNQPAAGVSVSFTLQKPAGGARSNRLISGRRVKVQTDGAGYFSVALQRNDLLVPAGTTWQVECAALFDAPRQFSLTDSLLDLKTLVSP